ncbi:unnamed protein product, partial [Closterium sp. NIES-53]
HHRLGHPSLLRLHGMHSRLLVSGLPKSLPPLPHLPALPCLPCVKGRQHAAPHSSSFPPTTAPVQTLHMDVWGPARRRCTLTTPLSSVSALVTTVAGFASSHRLDYAAHLVSGPARSPFFGGAPDFPPEVLKERQFELGFLAAAVPHLCAMLLAPEGDPDALDIPIPCNHAEAVSGPWDLYRIAAEEAEMASFWSTATYVDAVPPPGANVVSGMWLYKVKWPPGAPPVFKARYVVRGFNQREGVYFFQTFAPTLKMTTLRVLLHIAAQRDYELHSLHFSTAFLHGSLHGQIWLRRLPGFTGTFPPGTQRQLRRPVYGLRQAPREWHDTLRTALAALEFFPLSANPSLFVRRGSTPFFVLVYLDDLVFANPNRRALASVKEELQRRHTCTNLGMGLVLGGKQPVTLIGYSDSSWANDAESLQSTQGYFSNFGTGAISWRSTRASSVSSSSCEAEVYTAAMTAQELRWLSFLLTDVGEQPRSPLVLFADNRSAIVLCVLEVFYPFYPNAEGGDLAADDLVATRRSPRLETPLDSPPRPSSPPLQPVAVDSGATTGGDTGGEDSGGAGPGGAETEGEGFGGAETGGEGSGGADSGGAASPTGGGAMGAPTADYATSLVAESASASVCPPSIGGECALGTDVLEDSQEEFECFAASVPHLVSMLIAPEGDPDALDIPTPRSYAEAIEGPYSSQWEEAMDAKMASWKSTGTYVDEVPPPGANIVNGMWIFRVKRPPGSPPVFKARYVARGFSQRQGVDLFHTFSPTPKMTTLRVLLYIAAQHDYQLHSLDFSTAFLQGSLHEEIWLCHPPGFTGSFPAGTQWSLRWPVYGLRQAPRQWHDTLRMTLAAVLCFYAMTLLCRRSTFSCT